MNISKRAKTSLSDSYGSSNRINNVGEALETYIKDAFCDTFHESEYDKRITRGAQFSYLGNNSNPPDIVIAGSDAVEVKKVEEQYAPLALNSSHPKDKLHSDDVRINSKCRECEPVQRSEKDLLYIVGVAPKKTLVKLFFVYGDCYCADKTIYSRISEKISGGINEIPGVEFTRTKELAKVNKVDPLGITDLRVRGMRHIHSPFKVFQYLYKDMPDNDKVFAYTLMTMEKYTSFPGEDRIALESNSAFLVKDIKIQSPNNPAQLIAAKFIILLK